MSLGRLICIVAVFSQRVFGAKSVIRAKQPNIVHPDVDRVSKPVVRAAVNEKGQLTKLPKAVGRSLAVSAKDKPASLSMTDANLESITTELHSLEHRVEKLEHGAASITKAEACQVTVYEHWPTGMTVGIAGLEAAEQAWGGQFPTGASKILTGTGKHSLGTLSNLTSSVKVEGTCCKAYGYASADCSGTRGKIAIESTTHLLASLPIGVVTPATGLASVWGCNDCAQCVEVVESCPTSAAPIATTGSPTNSPTKSPTNSPTNTPTGTPTRTPTKTPTKTPTETPTETPTTTPTKTPTKSPTNAPTGAPTKTPTNSPTNSPTNPLMLTIWIDYHYHHETDACWEAFENEYTMKEMNYTVSGFNTVQQGCLECNNDASCHNYGNYQINSYTWGTPSSRSLDVSYRGWESDTSHRCTYSSGNWWPWDNDDCHHQDTCSSTIHSNVNGSFDCHGEHHGMTVKWEFTGGR